MGPTALSEEDLHRIDAAFVHIIRAGRHFQVQEVAHVRRLPRARGCEGEELFSRGWHFIAEQRAPAPHLAHPEVYAALRIVLVTVPCVNRSC